MLPLPGGWTRLFLLALVAGVCGGAGAVERKGAFQLMLSRPLVLGPLLGWVLGDALGGLVIGLPLELLFLGGVNLGGSLPDNETLLAGAMVAMAVPAGIAAGTGVDAPMAALATAVLFPLAWLGRGLERASERWNGAIAGEVWRRTEAGDPDAVDLNLRGLWLPFAATCGVCALATLVSPLLALVRNACGGQVSTALEGAWHALWAVAAAAAIRAIRDPRATALAAVAAAGAVGLGIALQGIP